MRKLAKHVPSLPSTFFNPERKGTPTIKHAADHQRTESRNKNAMRNSPVLFAGIIRGEETVVNTIADLSQASGDHFAEALLIADFVY